jgi:hypothetical protein
MIHDPLEPLSPNLGVRTVGDDCRILAGNGTLIGQPIGYPTLKLTARETSLMHELMKGMIGIIRRAERSKSLGQRFR